MFSTDFFKANNGYEGDDYCENQTTCNICTNEATPWNKDNNKHCSSITLLLIKCKFSTTWARGNFCQQSCYDKGNGYDKNHCCFSTKPETKTPSDHTSSFLSNKPNPLLRSEPSKLSTYEPTYLP